MSYARIQDALNREEDIKKYCKSQVELYAAARNLCLGGAIGGAAGAVMCPLVAPEAALTGLGLAVAAGGFATKAGMEYEKCVREETRKNKM